MTSLRDYEKVKVIGKGSFGEAVLVRHNGALVVMKRIQLSQLSKKEQTEAENEIRILRRLHHPNIVQYLNSFKDSSKLCIVMEYADGGDLSAKLKARRNVLLPEAEIMHIFLQLCLAMKHLHDQHILHRDLKTQNIFLTSHPTHPVVKLGDFGISTSLQNTMALARTMCGTPYYFSPELCQNRPYNNKSDVWSVGCVLYELCTLQHAFNGGSMQALLQKIVKGAYRQIPKSVPSYIRNLVADLLQRDPKFRPSINRVLCMESIRKRAQLLVESGPAASKPRVEKKVEKKVEKDSRENSVQVNDKLARLLAEKQKEGKERGPRVVRANSSPEMRAAPKTPVRNINHPVSSPAPASTPDRPASGGDRTEHLRRQAAQQKEQMERRMQDAIRRENDRQQGERKRREQQKQAQEARTAHLEQRRNERVLRQQGFERDMQERREEIQREEKHQQAKARRHSAPSERCGWLQVEGHVDELRRQMDDTPSKFAQMKGLPADPAAAAYLEAKLAAQMNRNKPCNPFQGDESRIMAQEGYAQRLMQEVAPQPAQHAQKVERVEVKQYRPPPGIGAGLHAQAKRVDLDQALVWEKNGAVLEYTISTQCYFNEGVP